MKAQKSSQRSMVGNSIPRAQLLAYSPGTVISRTETSTLGRLLQNFLTALDQASITPKRVLLQTGLKNYGVHLGPVNVPCEEHDARVELGQVNFYYVQEDILTAYCNSHPATSYNVTMPSW